MSKEQNAAGQKYNRSIFGSNKIKKYFEDLDEAELTDLLDHR